MITSSLEMFNVVGMTSKVVSIFLILQDLVVSQVTSSVVKPRF
jgi:hypothetical protein